MALNQVKKRGKGRPFVKGDPRIKPGSGPLSGEARSWALMLRNKVCERLSPDKAAEVLVQAYLGKRPWAVAEVHKMLVPELPRVIEGTTLVSGKVTVEVVQVKE